MDPQQPPPSFHLTGVNMDCADAEAMADFYGRLLGWQVTYRDNDYVATQDPSGGAGLSFQEEAWYQPPVWPEQPGELTKMIHLDIKVDDLDAAVAYALAEPASRSTSRARICVSCSIPPGIRSVCVWSEPDDEAHEQRATAREGAGRQFLRETDCLSQLERLGRRCDCGSVGHCPSVVAARPASA